MASTIEMQYGWRYPQPEDYNGLEVPVAQQAYSHLKAFGLPDEEIEIVIRHVRSVGVGRFLNDPTAAPRLDFDRLNRYKVYFGAVTKGIQTAGAINPEQQMALAAEKLSRNSLKELGIPMHYVHAANGLPLLYLRQLSAEGFLTLAGELPVDPYQRELSPIQEQNIQIGMAQAGRILQLAELRTRERLGLQHLNAAEQDEWPFRHLYQAPPDFVFPKKPEPQTQLLVRQPVPETARVRTDQPKNEDYPWMHDAERIPLQRGLVIVVRQEPGKDIQLQMNMMKPGDGVVVSWTPELAQFTMADTKAMRKALQTKPNLLTAILAHNAVGLLFMQGEDKTGLGPGSTLEYSVTFPTPTGGSIQVQGVWQPDVRSMNQTVREHVIPAIQRMSKEPIPVETFDPIILPEEDEADEKRDSAA